LTYAIRFEKNGWSFVCVVLGIKIGL